MKSANRQDEWLEQWYDWFDRVKRHLELDAHVSLSVEMRMRLIHAVDQDAIAGELFAAQIPPGKGRQAAYRIVKKLYALSVSLCRGLPLSLVPMGSSSPDP